VSGWEGGSTRAWRKIRAYVLARDQYRCQLKIEGVCTTFASHAHHLDGKAAGDDPARIVAACKECNLHIGDPARAPSDPEPAGSTWWDQ
jgi:5-methylcytosine-specific restriction endonuclease McrA